jgi:hypothetical protein
MEIYILNGTHGFGSAEAYHQTTVVDQFESLVWAERGSEYGDFVLTLHSTVTNRILFPVGTMLTIEESFRIMFVETVKDTKDSEGRSILQVSGRSFEKILLDRLARFSMSNLTDNPSWVLTDYPAAIARELFDHICAAADLNYRDGIYWVNQGSTTIFPTDTIPEPSDIIVYDIEPMTLYDAIKRLCDVYSMGFRLIRDFDSQLYFDIYMGSDRTTQQTDYPSVVFTPSMENLQNTTQLTTNAMYKNVAYVISPVGNEVVMAPGVDFEIDDIHRHVLFVRADDIQDTVPADATAKMIQRGTEELSRHRMFSAFDGEVSQNNQYKYGTDYHLMDLVEFQNKNGAISIMRVTEVIFVSDKEGDRVYPTLTIDKFVVEGSWNTAPADLVWNDADPDAVWNDGL